MNCSSTGRASPPSPADLGALASSWVSTRCLLIVVAMGRLLTPFVGGDRGRAGAPLPRRSRAIAVFRHSLGRTGWLGGPLALGRRRLGGARLGQGLLDQAGHLDAVLHPLVQHEL